MLKMFYSGGIESAEDVAIDYKKASDLWTIALSGIDNHDIEGIAEVINRYERDFSKINTTGTWEDAMVWTALMGCYDAQDGLSYSNGMYAQAIVDAFDISNCSTYVKRTAVLAYYTLRDQKVTRG